MKQQKNLKVEIKTQKQKQKGKKDLNNILPEKHVRKHRNRERERWVLWLDQQILSRYDR